MTDRFYPLGKTSAEDVWKSSYEIANEMRSFARSAYPPGYSGHEPGAREKFGFSTPGPDPWKLTKGNLALREDVDIAEPRRILSQTRTQVADERQNFEELDVPEMQQSYKSAIISPAFRSMAKSRSLPSVGMMTSPPKLSQLPDPISKLECDHFTYFVPKAASREGRDKLMSRSLTRLYKHPEKKVMLPYNGAGTGFRTQSGGTEWWPAPTGDHLAPTAYTSQFGRPSFYRMSPLNMVDRGL